MISHLHMENIAVIKNSDIYFSSGFNVLTGETGAGKSIIIKAINFLFGGKLNRGMIREGCNKLLVSAVLTDLSEASLKVINEFGYECEESAALIHREYGINGKNMCKINGRPATVSILKKIGSELADVYSQHEGYKLLSNDTHIKYIDIFGNLKKDLNEYKKIYDNMISVKKEITEVGLNECEFERKSSLLRYQIEEIESAQIYVGEVQKLNNIKNKYNNRQKILSLLDSVKNLLNGNESYRGILEELQESYMLLNEASNYVVELTSMAEKLQNFFYEISECSSDLNSITGEMDCDPGEIENIEQRLDIIYKLSRKYGKTESDILDFLDSSKKELEQLQNNGSKLEELENKFAKLSFEVNKMSKFISDKRRSAGKMFSDKVQSELEFLNMPKVKLIVKQETVDVGPIGCDKVQFLISANEGESLKPMSDVASGGELSRIMLAVKNVTLGNGGGTVIFDEVDTGVSGSAANKIGMKLKELSSQRQVICITHLAQIASLADEHFLIEKGIVDGHTVSRVKSLDFDGRKKELARIISGINVSDTTLKTAEEMLDWRNNI